MARHISEYFTLPGRVLVLLTMILAAGGMVAYIVWMWDGLPQGNYPVSFFALPVFLAATLFFALGGAVLKCFGVAVFKNPDAP
jgi:hypothetical protein